jgi:hypothetical protein
VGVRVGGIEEPRAARVRIRRGAVVDLVSNHDARLAVVGRLLQFALSRRRLSPDR